MKKTARFLVEKGFTLVELLIVIALIGVLAVAVLAAINPLEQLNRARDTGMESDASQLLAAIDRYYATQEFFPWVKVEPTTYKNDTALARTSARELIIGLCSTDCSSADPGGDLLTQFELKSEFLNRKFIKTSGGLVPGVLDQLYLAKNTGASSSVYACWVPTSNAKRAKAIFETAMTFPLVKTCDYKTKLWADLTDACFQCIPQ